MFVRQRSDLSLEVVFGKVGVREESAPLPSGCHHDWALGVGPCWLSTCCIAGLRGGARRDAMGGSWALAIPGRALFHGDFMALLAGTGSGSVHWTWPRGFESNRNQPISEGRHRCLSELTFSQSVGTAMAEISSSCSPRRSVLVWGCCCPARAARQARLGGGSLEILTSSASGGALLP